ncbi:MAG: zinc-binding dehydrogenase, partial [Terrimicrobiaceae bacterium]
TAVTRRCNTDWVNGLGAVDVVDYTETDYAAGSAQFDLVMDCVGAGTFRTLRHLVKPGGAYLAVAGGVPDFLARPSGGVRCVTGVTPESSDVVNEMIGLVNAGKFRPMVGDCFPFDQLPAAHALVDTRHKRGVVVVEFDS